MDIPKRVSFGSKGSMVETWIIYDDNKDSQSLQESDTPDQQTQQRYVSSNSRLKAIHCP
ncbi:Hypothetical predicted protein [Octopus vulgaris]|uniref:Uncharacterized protein n=1 Tax=Octopus vulgaris TaxID=6645 RepID=A0AA36C0C9_OCTVU|nr:Hypothetical predicted protein [Octopus vulgaris]